MCRLSAGAAAAVYGNDSSGIFEVCRGFEKASKREKAPVYR